MYFKRYSDGEKQLVYEFFNKHLFEELIKQLEVLKYDKYPQKIENCDIYYNDKNIISLRSYMLDYDGMEVKRFVCAVERANEVMKIIDEIKRLDVSEYNHLNYKGITFKYGKEWGIDTTMIDGRLNVMCSSENGGFAFKVEAVPVGANNIDSSKLKATALRLLEITTERGGLITSKYMGNFSIYGGYVFEFTQRINDIENLTGRKFIFSEGNYLVMLTMMATFKSGFDTVFKEIECSFKID